jgi:energy-coupling factor transporter transmembrane protein EcfT
MVLLGGVAVLARPRARWLARRAAAASMAVAAIVVPFVLAGQTERAAEFAFRAATAVALALTFAATISLADLPRALATLRVPRALSGAVHALLWQLEHVGDEGQRLLLARRLRGARGAFGPEVLSSLLARTAIRAERVDVALALRGVRAPESRDGLRRTDWVATVAVLAFAVALHVGR